MRTGERGFTYLWLLFVVAIGGAALAAAGTAWKTQAQRERERELLFRGGEIARAIAAYHAASTEGAAQWPAGLDELLEDRRGGVVRRHLRRLYADPFTGKPDWLLVVGEHARILAVRSRSPVQALMSQEFGPAEEPGRPVRVSDKTFAPANTAPAAPSAPAPAARP